METIEQPKQVSIVEQQKKEAAEFVAGRIENLVEAEKISNLDAVRRVYEEVKEHDYRKEQATAKLLECLEMANELAMRKKEMEHTYPELTNIIIGKAANDDKYSVLPKAA